MPGKWTVGHFFIVLQRVLARRAALQQLDTAIGILLFQQDIKPPQTMDVLEHFPTPFIQRDAIVRHIAQRQ